MRDNQSVTDLLGYIDRCITSKNIMLVTFDDAVIMINALIGTKSYKIIPNKLLNLLLKVYVLATLVKRNSAYSCHLETNDSLYIGPV